jgi:hypothetical protein
MTLPKVLFPLFIVAMTLGAAIVFTPTGTAEACLPCKCPVENPPVNCYGPYSFFVHWVPGNAFDIEIMAIDPNGNQERVIYLTAKELAALPAHPEQHMLIAEAPDLWLYKLSYGDYQVNAKSPTEKKVFFAIFSAADGNLIEEGDYPTSD